MKKKSNQGLPCIFCERDAVPNSDPPMCEHHMKLDKKAGLRRYPKTLKELDALDGKGSDEQTEKGGS